MDGLLIGISNGASNGGGANRDAIARRCPAAQAPPPNVSSARGELRRSRTGGRLFGGAGAWSCASAPSAAAAAPRFSKTSSRWPLCANASARPIRTSSSSMCRSWPAPARHQQGRVLAKVRCAAKCPLDSRRHRAGVVDVLEPRPTFRSREGVLSTATRGDRRRRCGDGVNVRDVRGS
jgi:hypothetical protein